MSRLFFCLISLALASALMFGQPTTVPPSPPLPSVPVSTTPVSQCGPIVDVVMMGGGGSLVSTCEGSLGKVSSSIIASGFPGGFVDNAVQTTDGATIITMDNGNVVRIRDRASQWFPLGRASTFLRGDYNQVTLLREDGATWQYFLNWDGSFSARPVQEERLLPSRCTKVFQNSPTGDLFCVDRNNGSISRANASLMRPARPDEAQKYVSIRGLIDAVPYQDGIIALVTAQYDCGEPVPIPESATLCYSSEQCKEIEPAVLLHITGRENPQTRVIAKGLGVVYSSTLKAKGGEVLVVESRYNGNAWLGDEVIRYDIRTGQRSLYWTLDIIRTQYGPEPKALWLVN